MLPGAFERPSKLGDAVRHLLRRYWPFFLLLPTGLLFLSASSYTPPQYRLSFFNSRPSTGRRPPQVSVPKGDLWAGRANEVRKAFKHGYEGYRKFALPKDELKPMTPEGVNNFHGWGVTMYDSLDTMWLMGLEDLFYKTVDQISAETFNTPPDEYAHFFEVVIRYLGGLLSAYGLSEDPRLLTLAERLGEKLMPAFDSPSGFPYWGVDTTTGEPQKKQKATCMAEAFSNQMEYKYLAHITGKAKFYTATDKPMKALHKPDNIVAGGLYGTIWNLATGLPNSTAVGIGGCADSAYEYFLKQWLMTGQREPKMRDLYLHSANSIIENMLYVSANRPMLYASDLIDGKPRNHFEHLTCFLPAVFALGARAPALGLSPQDKERHLWAAEGLANTCWTMYNDMQSGLSPDHIVLEQWSGYERSRWVNLLAEWQKKGKDGLPPGVAKVEREPDASRRGYATLKDAYLLRPETVETFYLMWRTTGDVKWRERGWEVFQSIEKYTRVKFGYTSVRYLDEKTYAPARTDDQPSWFFAETLKYLFLLFTDEELVPLDKYVFNTEAHPFPVFEWTPKEIAEFPIEM
ncbi:alpha-1,2-Mannosidase [Mycena indigotica]|uniref:alpha-1,2-Mannosidase n=1 Tax=Mycena indigotica TaxID=2126181 RepID=A0A8H6VSA8_9AGAR|nr:alpha-1,2-Mannosidase [Mycena indigotica]KAF7291974.1 alpha-1,2-Mannosidase [Mycena indigotica]